MPDAAEKLRAGKKEKTSKKAALSVDFPQRDTYNI